MRCRWATVAALIAGCSGDTSSSGPRTGCANDPSGCPGSCNAQQYCEHDFGWGPEIRVPAKTYVVTYRGDDVIFEQVSSLVTFPTAFWISKHETTREQYARCTTCPPLPDAGQSIDPAMPAEVLRVEAEAYCAASGRRLPTEPEWEAAGRGPATCDDPRQIDRRTGDEGCNARSFPWGGRDTEREQQTRAHTSRYERRTGPRPVAPHPEGASPLGVEEMIGNVGEWVSYDAGPRHGTLKGGSWQPDPQNLVVPRHSLFGVNWVLLSLERAGVRCVRGGPMQVEHRYPEEKKRW